MVMAMAMGMDRATPSLLRLSLGLPVAAPHPLRKLGGAFRDDSSPPLGIRFVSATQWVAEAKRTDVNETSRDPFSVLASMLVAGACAAAFGCSTPHLGAAYAAEGVTEDSRTTFQRSCAGCHAGGGNILQPNATLFAKDLDRNGMANVDDVFQITYFGKGRMPGYGEKCTPRGQCTFGPRLSDSDIRALAEFVRLQADQGWAE